MFKSFLQGPLSFLFSLILQFVLFCLFLTCRWKVYNVGLFKKGQKKHAPILLCCWHSRFVLVAKYLHKINLPVWAVSSTHRDSEIMARILLGWSFKLIRGSSTRGWRNVIKKMLVLFKESDSVVALTNDGPKGPPHIAKPGAVALAEKHGAQIIAVSASASSLFSLPSWDKTKLPMPFSTIHVQFSQPFTGIQNKHEASKEISSFIEDNFKTLNGRIIK